MPKYSKIIGNVRIMKQTYFGHCCPRGKNKREREREIDNDARKGRDRQTHTHTYKHIYMYIYIYIPQGSRTGFSCLSRVEPELDCKISGRNLRNIRVWDRFYGFSISSHWKHQLSPEINVIFTDPGSSQRF